MGLGAVGAVVLPAFTLLHSKLSSPIALGEEALGKGLGHLLGEDHVAVLVASVLVLLGIFNLMIVERVKGAK